MTVDDRLTATLTSVATRTADLAGADLADLLAVLRWREDELDPALLGRLDDAVRGRHRDLQHTSGLNAEVFDALHLLASGSWDHNDLRRGSESMAKLTLDMRGGRRARLIRLGFAEEQADELAGLHTRNFM